MKSQAGRVERLLDSDATPFERQLLESARAEPLPAELSARMQQALGLSNPVAPAPAVVESSSWFGSKGAAVLIAGALAVGGGLSLWRLTPEKPVVESQSDAPTHAQAAPKNAEPAREAPALPADDSSALREEIELVDSIRAALQSNEYERARALLGRYAQRFPAGALAHEADALRKRADAVMQNQRQGRAERAVEAASRQ